MDEGYGYTQTAEPAEQPGFSYGVNTGGEFHVDGTPMRVVSIIAVGVILLLLINRGKIRYHVIG